MLPSSYLTKFYLDTIVFTPEQPEALVKLFGVEKNLLRTDSPSDMGEYIASVKSFADADRAAIVGGKDDGAVRVVMVWCPIARETRNTQWPRFGA